MTNFSSSSTVASLTHLQMIPSEAQLTAKRKATDDSNPLLNAAKRSKKEGKSGASSKRKLLNAEETPGGLLIVRAPDARQPSSQPPASRAGSSQPPPFPFLTAGAGPSKPPSKKFRAGSQPPAASSSTIRPRAASTAARDRTPLLFQPDDQDPNAENDVRAMNDEADHLRRNSRVPTSSNSFAPPLNPAFQFPPRAESSNRKGKGKTKITDTSEPIAENETPQIERNKLLREGAMAAIGNGRSRGAEKGGGKDQSHRRKSSFSRGKRISSSFEATGVISQPHNTVSDSSFYKHIDCDLPDSERVRQLLIWCSLRASGSTLGISSSGTPSKPKRPPPAPAGLPPLSAKGAEVFKDLQDDLVRMLAEKRIDVSMYGAEASGSGSAAELGEMKENEQNVRNRGWEVTYTNHIQKAQEEDEAWKKVSYAYEAYGKKLQASIDTSKYDEAEQQHPLSAKAKGKRRATGDLSSDPESLPNIRIHELPPDLQQGATLAQSVLGIGEPGPSSSSSIGRRRTAHEAESSLSRRIPEIQFKLDHLHTFLNSARAATNIAERMLNERFDALNAALVARRVVGDPSRTGTSGATQLLTTYVKQPGGTGGGGGGPDPLEVMRALSRVDRERPPGMVGDAARRAAREVQRVGESGVGAVGERRLTGVPVPSTPRKVPGTPRRGGTPGRERER